MTWFKTDDGFWRHRKVRRLGRAKVSVPAQVACAGLWQLAGNWAADNGSDGFVPAEQVEQWDPRLLLAARLVDVGLWHRADVDGEPGYQFHDWHDYNPSAAEVDEKRAKRAAAGRRGGVKSGESRRSKTEANASPRDGNGTVSERPLSGLASPVGLTVTGTETVADTPEFNTHAPDDLHIYEANASRLLEAKTNPVPTRIGDHLPTTAARNVEREHAPEQIHTGPGITGPRAVDAKALVGRHIGHQIPAIVRTALAIEVAQLMPHYDEPTLVQALEQWKNRTGIGPRILPNLVADIIKDQTNPNAYGVRSSGSGARSARSEKVTGWLELGAEFDRQLAEQGGDVLQLIEGGRSA